MPNDALRAARAIFDAAVARVDPRVATRAWIEANGARLAPGEGGRLVVVGFGKAAAAMAAEAEDVLGARVSGGVVITKVAHAVATRVVKVAVGGHPTPDEAGLRGAADLRAAIDGLGERDVVLCLVSGGGSALLTAPAEGVSLADLERTTAALLAAGAPIDALNAVRKHVETLKGGGLAAAAWPARVVSLVVSDVLGDRLDVVASGPTVGDTSTFADARAVLDRYGVDAPEPVRRRLAAGARGEIAETPRPDDPRLARTENVLVANLAAAAAAARDRAAAMGFVVTTLPIDAAGEARDVGRALAARALAAPPDARPRCWIGGGETTVTVRGKGRGGRNTELALAAAIALDGRAAVAVASLATDGDDGTTGAAGAVATGETAARGRALGLDAGDYLARNDSATFFERVGGLVVTGPTRTNVCDLHVVIFDAAID